MGLGVTDLYSDQAFDVELRAVTKRFGPLTAVSAVTLKVHKGEFLSLLGPSGCGKTTSLRLIAGFEQPDEGEILIGGRDAADAPPYRRDVNTVFQHYALFPHMSVLDNVAYGLKQRKVDKPQRYAKARKALELVRMTGRENARPSMLSGGRGGAAKGTRVRVGLRPERIVAAPGVSGGTANSARPDLPPGHHRQPADRRAGLTRSARRAPGSRAPGPNPSQIRPAGPRPSQADLAWVRDGVAVWLLVALA